MIKNGKNIDAKLSRATCQHGSKIGFSFFTRPGAVSYDDTKQQHLVRGSALTLHTLLLLGFSHCAARGSRAY